VSLGDLFDFLIAHAGLMSAIVPILVAIALRIFFGGGRVTNVLVSLATVWFTVNVLATPYSFAMQQDIERVRQLFR